MQLTFRRCLVLVTGCVLLGLGVAMLLAADPGSDGYSTLINGLARSIVGPTVSAMLPLLMVLALAPSGSRC